MENTQKIDLKSKLLGIFSEWNSRRLNKKEQRRIMNLVLKEFIKIDKLSLSKKEQLLTRTSDGIILEVEKINDVENLKTLLDKITELKKQLINLKFIPPSTDLNLSTSDGPVGGNPIEALFAMIFLVVFGKIFLMIARYGYIILKMESKNETKRSKIIQLIEKIESTLRQKLETLQSSST
jgi:hypothetical protein